jgi:ketosteroid isomerase-like protein
MSMDNVELVRSAYRECSDRHDMPPTLFVPDFEVDSTDVGPGNFGIIRGLDLAHRQLRDYWEIFDGFRVEIEQVIHHDENCVVTVVRDGGRLRESGGEVSNRFYHVWTVAGGRATRLSIHTNRGKALEAAGHTG